MPASRSVQRRDESPFFGFFVSLAFAAAGRRCFAVAACLVSIGLLLKLFKPHATSSLDIVL
ncbi:hypothetical protein GCM10017643_23040 [Ancylobacter dichloromethanicus]|uniref:Uncharacterized protein n=1 Tax=Ancylobacter dichloromethanicus TaxID=518825 RepID=A0A9W6JAS4_9HYPH|nr:DUF5993 family protein [Ancylobacter dichloromethanicus]GLK72188.1 hypothetical protein GCM10017643_23040 [Ancylobacter dichloromethanicus]